jgi:hypothetical protein
MNLTHWDKIVSIMQRIQNISIHLLFCLQLDYRELHRKNKKDENEIIAVSHKAHHHISLPTNPPHNRRSKHIQMLMLLNIQELYKRERKKNTRTLRTKRKRNTSSTAMLSLNIRKKGHPKSHARKNEENNQKKKTTPAQMIQRRT